MVSCLPLETYQSVSKFRISIGDVAEWMKYELLHISSGPAAGRRCDMSEANQHQEDELVRPPATTQKYFEENGDVAEWPKAPHC